MNTSRDPRLEENTNGVVVDHHTISTTGVCVREGGLGETGTGGVATILADYTPDQLIALAHALGIELGLHAEWNGWQRQLRQWQPDELYLLIGWCAFYRANSHLLDAVRNLPGIIRKNIKDHSPAYLRPSDLDQLAQDAATIIMAETI